jgi:hypothetical protein
MWVTIKDFHNGFEICMIPELMKIIGHKKDLSVKHFNAKELIEDQYGIDDGILKLLCGEDINRKKWSFNDLLQTNDLDVDSFLDGLWCDYDSRFDDVRLNITPKTVALVMDTLKLSKTRVAEELVFSLKVHVQNSLAQYMQVEANGDLLSSKLVRKLVRLPNGKFYEAVYQIIREGVKHGRRGS